jgi:CHAT domain-containing protein
MIKINQALLLLVFTAAPILEAKTIVVPRDYLTIKSAVIASRPGDTVEVEDGLYFEKNIILDKVLTVRAQHLFGATIIGSRQYGECIFLVRAQADIGGFVLANSVDGIRQRGSLDITWRAHDLAIINMINIGIYINDSANNIGSATIENIIFDRCEYAVATNDARDVRVQQSFAANCGRAAFQGIDHVSFKVGQTLVWNCPSLTEKPNTSLILSRPQATNLIELEDTVTDVDEWRAAHKTGDLRAFVTGIFREQPSSGFLEARNTANRACLVDTILGDISSLKNEPAAAITYYRAAMETARAMKNHAILLRTLSGLARVEEKSGDFAASIESYKEAIEEIDEVVNGFPFKFLQTGYFNDKIDVYESLLDLLYRQYKTSGRKSFAESAFYYSEKMKSIGLLQSLSGTKSRLDETLNAEDERRGSLIAKDISRIQLQLYDGELSPERNTLLSEQLENREDEYKSILIKKHKKTEARFLAGQEMRPFERRPGLVLDSETALLEYFIGERRAFGFSLTHDAVEMALLPAPEILDSLIPNYLKYLGPGGSDRFLGQNGSQKLFDILVGPFTKSLPSQIKRMIVIPDGVLSYLPFETLSRPDPPSANGRRPRNPEGGHFLIEDFELSYAPSASFLAALANLPPIERTTFPDLAILVDADARPVRLYPNAGPSDFPNLSYALAEARRIKSAFENDKKAVTVRNRASEDDFKTEAVAGAKIIHITAHGVYDEKYWWRSGLLLNPGATGFEDGILQPFDIMSVRMNPALIVLSACQTGSGRIERGEGMMGLTSSFFIAGARSILSSLWTVNDRSTADFMKHLYRYLLQGKPKGQAIRLAKLDMLRSKYAHPFYWAGFVLVGDYLSAIF